MKMRTILNFAKGALGLAALAAFVLALVGLFGPLSQRVPVGQQAYPIGTVTPTAPPLPVTPTPQPYPPPQTPTVVPLATPTTMSTHPSPTLVGTPTPALPTPTPPGYTPVYTGTPPTATPYPGEIRPPAVFVTPTPLPISKITDLAPDLPNEEKSVCLVRYADETYGIFRIRPGTDISEIPLNPGDLVIDCLPPASLTGHYVVKWTPTVAQVTPTKVP